MMNKNFKSNKKLWKICILGNGFDLAHNLPTSYNNFLEAMETIELYNSNKVMTFVDLFKKSLDSNNEFIIKTQKLYKTDESSFSISENDIILIKDKLSSNSWYKYFKYKQEESRTWADFEEDIYEVLKILSKLFRNGLAESKIKKDEYYLKQNFLKDYVKIELTETLEADFRSAYPILKIFNLALPKGKNHNNEVVIHKDLIHQELINDISISFNKDKIFDNLANSLFNFAKIFEDYVNIVINTLKPVKGFEFFKSMNDYQRVYTFNYSDTFQRFYLGKNEAKPKLNYLHGEATQHNIVFGISELENESNKDIIDSYALELFSKANQVVKHGTDYQYLNDEKLLIDDKSASVDYHITIWGHSLNNWDQNYIQKIFGYEVKENKPKVFINILYYSIDNLKFLLTRLQNIIGEDILKTRIKEERLYFNYIDSLNNIK